MSIPFATASSEHVRRIKDTKRYQRVQVPCRQVGNSGLPNKFAPNLLGSPSSSE